MTKVACNSKKILQGLTILLIAFVAATSVLASCFAKPNFAVNANLEAIPSASLNNLNFTTYTYGGKPIQQPNASQLSFSFPDKTVQGQLAGSDALSLGGLIIQRLDFDAVFYAPKIDATGFDEMVVFAASDTTTYKGTEFGVRLDLKDGCIYGYVQEPNGIPRDVYFEMFKLIANDGASHHYTLIKQRSQVSFYIDGLNYGYLNYPSRIDYTGYSFSVFAVVHRFTDGWDSTGDNMLVENFSVNLQ